MSHEQRTFELARLHFDRQFWITALETATDPFSRSFAQASLDAVTADLKEMQDA